MKRYLAVLLLLLTFNNFAQQVSNIHSIQEGKQVIITYAIASGNNGDKFDVKLYYSQNSNDWKEVTVGLTGDVGPDITPGTNKTIHWSPLKELNKLTGSGYSFKVKASIEPSDPYSIAANMVIVDSGTFTMGCTGEQVGSCNNDEKPSHTVNLKSFSICKYEVTQAQWQEVMGDNPSFKVCNNCPVVNVSWEHVLEFISRLNKQTEQQYRLPTEAEWEYAARGGKNSKGYKYSGSNSLKDVAWFYENSERKINEVGHKLANELGIYDMSGNAWEWCQDLFGVNYFEQSPYSNPTGPADSGSYRVVRGGSWDDNDNCCRVSFRIRGLPNFNYSLYGFRLAQDL